MQQSRISVRDALRQQSIRLQSQPAHRPPSAITAPLLMDERSPDDVPSELRAFMYSCIDSVEQVEILALLCRSAKPRSARAVALELRLTDITTRHHLETLVARGLLQTAVGAEVTYAYAPKSADLRRYGDQLTEFYTHSRTSVLRCIAATPRGAKRFSDAFKLREPGK